MLENFQKRLESLKLGIIYSDNATENAIFRVLLLIAEMYLYDLMQKYYKETPNYTNRGF